MTTIYDIAKLVGVRPLDRFQVHYQARLCQSGPW